jgi:hypothetical protein
VYTALLNAWRKLIASRSSLLPSSFGIRSPAVRRVQADRPVELVVVVPLVPHADLAAHEQKLLARRRPLVAEQQPEVGEPLPIVARHLAEQ